MSETKWTNEQWEAITEKDCNLLVAAAAGAGKTAVLVERIVRKITDEKNPIDIDRLLIVTFTNAAATEMRERISEAISKVLEKNPESVLIQRQLALLGKASITTIHSFCMEVIRNNFQSINIDPDFRIADETESSLMKLEALNELFEEQYENESNEEFFELLECYGGNRDDQTLMDMVLNLYEFIQSSPWPNAWLDEMTGNLDVPVGTDFGKTPWGKVLLSSISLELEGLKDMLTRAIELVRTGLGLEKYQTVYREDLVNIESLITLLGTWESAWDRLYYSLQSLEFTTLPRAGKEVDKERQDTVKKIRDDVKARIKKLREKIITADSAEITGDLKALYPKMKCLAGLVTGMSEKYSEKKSRKSVTDFNDLEHFCLEILSEKDADGKFVPSLVAQGYRERFLEVLVDEYQDSNLVQEIMISMITGRDKWTGALPQLAEQGSCPPVPPCPFVPLFQVGDVKQSIYRFRQARPELFMNKYNTYSTQKGEANRKILLFRNFRSRKTVIDAVNFIFKQIMSVNAGELDYTDIEALNPGAVFEENTKEDLCSGGDTELHLIQTNSINEGISAAAGEESGEAVEVSEDEQEEEEILDNIQCEARLVVKRIQKLLKPDDEGRFYSVWDKNRKEYRKVEFRDIVILLRTTRNWSEVFVDEMALFGIPAFADTGSGFFKTIEVQVILSLLQVIDNPLQDIPLLSVLRSPIASYSTDELAGLRLADRKGPLFNGLCKLAENGDDASSKKAAVFLWNLAKWREMSAYYSTDRLIWHLYNETGYYGMVGAMPAGEQRQANLRILFERARQFEDTSYKGLFNFINFIDRLKGSKGDMGSAKTLSENDNVVRIMSIHKSKGLEFPVVFLSGCGKRFNLQDMNKSILLHQDLGFGPDVVDHRLRLSWPSAAKQAIREKIKSETLSEEMRILYVALTRAREKLIITGTVNDLEKAVTRWTASAGTQESKLPDYEMLKGGNFLDWICPALLRHKNCSTLRDNAPIGTEFRGNLIEDTSRWSIGLWNKSDVQTSRISEENGEGEFISWLDGLTSEKIDEQISIPRQISPEGVSSAESDMTEKKKDNYSPTDIMQEIDRKLGWEYAYAGVSDIPAKVSVTELKRRFNTQSSEESGTLPGYPAKLVSKHMFLEEKKGLTSAERGTILHFIMQHLDLSKIRASFSSNQAQHEPLRFLAPELSNQIDYMVAKDLLTRQQAESADINKISRFFDSELGRRMLLSDSINREVPFNIEIPCGEIYKDIENECQGDTVLLQGVIDCFFEESDGIVLIDYKTDYVPDGKEEIIKDRYKLQIYYYSRTLELLTGKKVKDKFIYLFWNGTVLKY